MARPVEYDRDMVLRNATRVFWLKGYQSASMADLLDATGLTSRSLYNIFGSKNGLFKAALETYYQGGFGPALAKLEAGQGREAVQEYVRSMTNGGEPLNGCLFVNTLADKTAVEEDAFEIVSGFFNRLEQVLKERLTYARKHQAFKGDPGVTAARLVVFLQGLGVYSKMNPGSGDHGRLALEFLELIGV